MPNKRKYLVARSPSNTEFYNVKGYSKEQIEAFKSKIQLRMPNSIIEITDKRN